MERNNHLKIVLLFFLIIFLLQFTSGILLFYIKLGFTHANLKDFYLGSEERFINPKTFSGLLEVTLLHLIAVSTVLFIFFHFLSLFFPQKDRVKTFLANTCFIGAIVNISGGYLIRFIHPVFVYVKLISFVFFEIILFLIVYGKLMYCTYTAPKNMDIKERT